MKFCIYVKLLRDFRPNKLPLNCFNLGSLLAELGDGGDAGLPPGPAVFVSVIIISVIYVAVVAAFLVL